MRGGRTALYRFFTAGLDPVYYGITNNVLVRFADHRRKQRWWPEVDERRTVVVWFPNRDAAAIAELAAIDDEKPKHNIATTSGGTGRRPWVDAASHEAIERGDQVVSLHHQIASAKAAFLNQLVKVADPAGDAVPIAHLAERLGIERKAVYRYLNRTAA